ncbi:Histone deacetylase complex subunit, partial [Coemansia sp. RSA 1804]
AAKAKAYNNNNNSSSSTDSHLFFTSLFRRAENTLLGTNGVAPPDPTRRNRRHARCSSFRTTAACKPTSDSVPAGNRAAGCCCYAHYTPAFRVDYQACVRQMVVGSMDIGSSQERKDSRSIRSANVNDSGNGNGGNNSSRSSNGAQNQKPNIPPTNDGVDEEEKEDEKAGDADQDDGNSDEDEDDDDEEDDDDDEDGDDGVVRCVCGERNDGELMIECEICQVWQHTLCMGIRDEAHIPDKYYCEKCRPEDHPYINSRPRTLVLAEASALGTSTMMRRSAVMAVAKMTAREEYRSAAAAAAIAASVAAASSSGPPSAAAAAAAGRKTPKKQARKPNGGTPS